MSENDDSVQLADAIQQRHLLQLEGRHRTRLYEEEEVARRKARRDLRVLLRQAFASYQEDVRQRQKRSLVRDVNENDSMKQKKKKNAGLRTPCLPPILRSTNESTQSPSSSSLLLDYGLDIHHDDDKRRRPHTIGFRTSTEAARHQAIVRAQAQRSGTDHLLPVRTVVSQLSDERKERLMLLEKRHSRRHRCCRLPEPDRNQEKDEESPSSRIHTMLTRIHQLQRDQIQIQHDREQRILAEVKRKQQQTKREFQLREVEMTQRSLVTQHDVVTAQSHVLMEEAKNDALQFIRRFNQGKPLLASGRPEEDIRFLNEEGGDDVVEDKDLSPLQSQKSLQAVQEVVKARKEERRKRKASKRKEEEATTAADDQAPTLGSGDLAQ